jgi:hypothetical protein
MIEQAILKINPNAKFTLAQNSVSDYEIIWLEGTTPISKEDIETQFLAVEQEIKDAKQTKIDKKASAVTKLKALGLDDAEIEALKS